MRYILLSLSLLTLSILSSCASLKADKFVEGQIAVTKENMHLLEGNYQRFSTAKQNGFREDLFRQIANKGNGLKNDSLWYVRLRVIDDRHIEASLLHPVGLLKRKILKGKVKNGYFERRRRYMIIPALIVNLFQNTKLKLGITENGNLTTDRKTVGFYSYVIIPIIFQDKSLDNQFEKIH